MIRSPVSCEIEVAGILARYVARGLNKDEVIIQTSPGNIQKLQQKLLSIGQPCIDMGGGRAMVTSMTIKWKTSSGEMDEDCSNIFYGRKLGLEASERAERLQRELLRVTSPLALTF